MNGILIRYANGRTDLCPREKIFFFPQHGILVFAERSGHKVIFTDRIESVEEVKIRKETL